MVICIFGPALEVTHLHQKQCHQFKEEALFQGLWARGDKRLFMYVVTSFGLSKRVLLKMNDTK